MNDEMEAPVAMGYSSQSINHKNSMQDDKKKEFQTTVDKSKISDLELRYLQTSVSVELTYQ